MMAVVLWIVVALATVASGVFAAFSRTGYRLGLVSCLVVGLTPLGFIAGPGIAVSIPELLLVALAFAFLAREFRTLSDLQLPAVVLVFAAYFLLQLIFAFLLEEARLFDIVRDLRPVAFIGLLLILSTALRQASTSHKVKESLLFTALLACVLVDLIFYASTAAGLISAGGISGEFFLRTGLLRYSDLLTISIFGIANYFVFYNKERPLRSLYWLLICAAVVVLSLNRIFALGFLIALSWWVYVAMRNVTKSPAAAFLAAATPVIALAAAGFAFVQSNEETGEVISRVTELFDISLLIGALKYRFVEPAILGGYELTTFTFLFGEGIGFKFFVPWFSYRGLDPWHFSVDSLFAFAFFKYGAVGLIIWVYAISRFFWFRAWTLANAWVWLYLLAHSGVNVPSFLLLLIVLVVLRDGSWLEANGGVSRDLEEQVKLDWSDVPDTIGPVK